MPYVMFERSAGPSIGCLTKDSSTTARRNSSRPTIQILASLEACPLDGVQGAPTAGISDQGRHCAAMNVYQEVGRDPVTDHRLWAVAAHGLRQATPSGSKCRVLRVTTVISAAWATAPMSASSSGACSGTR